MYMCICTHFRRLEEMVDSWKEQEAEQEATRSAHRDLLLRAGN
jgi:hypothetical protein